MTKDLFVENAFFMGLWMSLRGYVADSDISFFQSAERVPIWHTDVRHNSLSSSTQSFPFLISLEPELRAPEQVSIRMKILRG
jgi:hypothetical protein